MMQVSIDDLINGNWYDVIFGQVPGLIGEPIFGLLIGGSVLLGFYVAGDGDLATPTVVLMLLASVMVPVLPGSAQSIAWAIAVVGSVAMMLAVARAYIFEGGGYR
jgi:hypothetical protein